jgi:hypothetical protein
LKTSWKTVISVFEKKWKEIIAMGVRKMGCEDVTYIGLAQDGVL